MYWQMKISMLVGYAQNIAVENTKTLTKNTSLLKKWRLQELIISSGLTNYLVLANWYWLVFNCISFVKQPSEESSINTAFFLKSTHLVSKNISSKHVIPTFNTVPESWPSGCAFLKSLIPFYQMLNFFFFFKVCLLTACLTSPSDLLGSESAQEEEGMTVSNDWERALALQKVLRYDDKCLQVIVSRIPDIVMYIRMYICMYQMKMTNIGY